MGFALLPGGGFSWGGMSRGVIVRWVRFGACDKHPQAVEDGDNIGG